MYIHNNFSSLTMPRDSQHPKDESFNFRVDPKLKAAFQSATEAEDKPAAQVLREFMRAYVERHRQRAFHRSAAPVPPDRRACRRSGQRRGRGDALDRGRGQP